MKIDASCMQYLSRDEYRVLTAVEMGLKNHDTVPIELIGSIAKLRHGGVQTFLSTLLRFKLVSLDRSHYDGYRLTYHGYDILAIKTLLNRGHIATIGQKIAVGKESDIYIAQDDMGDEVVLKFHRLGRVSFRAVKNKRDYLQHRKAASWLYLSRLAALREFAFMKALHREGFPTPTPIDHNRHVVLMSKVDGFPLSQVQAGKMARPERVFSCCMSLITQLARRGLIHCDFNEFNLIINEDSTLTLIDFPQMVSISHLNARELFERDVNCVVKFFSMKMHFVPTPEEIPSFHKMISVAGEERQQGLDEVLKASGFNGSQPDQRLPREMHRCRRRAKEEASLQEGEVSDFTGSHTSDDVSDAEEDTVKAHEGRREDEAFRA